MNFFEQVTSLIRAGGCLEDLGRGLARVLDNGRLSGFVFYGKRDRCLVTVPYRDEPSTALLRDRFEGADWRERPREAFLAAFAGLEVPTGEIGEFIRWSFLGNEEDPLGAFACVREPAAAPPSDTERKVSEFFFRLAGELALSGSKGQGRVQDAEERDYLLEVMNQVGRLMLERPDRAQLLPSLLKIALDTVRTEVGSITLESGGRFVTEVEWGLPGELLEGIRLQPDGRGILERMRQTLEPVIIDDVSGPTVRLPDGFPVHVSSLVAVPLLAGDRLIGVLSVATGEDGREVLPSSVSSLNTIASLIATALENLRLREGMAARAEEAHQGKAQEQKLLGQVLANLRVGVLVSDSAGRIVITNPAAEEMLGLGGTGSRRYPERNVVTLRPFFTWLRERWASDREVEEAEFDLDVQPPAVFTVRIHPLKGVGDRFRRMTVILEGALRNATGAQPLRPERIAEEIERPLAAARTSLDLICDGDRKGPAAMIAARSLSRIGDVAEDLRDLAHITGGTMKVYRTQFSLAGLLEEVFQEFAAEFGERGIAYRGPDPSAGGMIHADRVLLGRALRRLVAAVVRFTTEEGWIRADLAEDLGTLAISIDFLQSQASQGFEESFASSQAAGWTGAGRDQLPGMLSLKAAQAVVDLHGGRIRAKSERDLEGQLSVQLPLAGDGQTDGGTEEAHDLGPQFFESRA